MSYDNIMAKIGRMRADGSWNEAEEFLDTQRIETIIDLIDRASSLTKEEIIEAGAKLEVLERMKSMDAWMKKTVEKIPSTKEEVLEREGGSRLKTLVGSLLKLLPK